MERDLHNLNKKRDLIELPAGFRFHPSDEELITHYLHPKALDGNFTTIAIGDVDLNKVEPWDLPWKANMGENEWYFFCLRDRKYPTGLRTNRATVAGYWKATGKDKDILRSKSVIGMKKTLVFYRGRAPRGEKTDWVMHEFRLHGKYSMQNLPKTSKNEWVICRVFKKSSGGKKSEISELYRNRDYHCNTEDSRTSVTELSSEEYNPRTSVAEVERAKPRTNHVACFTDNKEDDPQEQTLQEFNSRNSDYYHQFPFMLPGISTTDSTFTRSPNAEFVDNLSCQKQSINGLLQENKNNGSSTKQNCDSVYLHEAWDDLDCLWN